MQDWYRDGYPRSVPQHGYKVQDWTNCNTDTERIILPDPPAPEQEPEVLETKELSGFERGLDIVKNIMVILTCLLILYGFVELVLFINNLSNALEEFSNRLGEGI